MKEWVITNGLGGFASSTDLGGMNTRRYHGLLIAALEPPRNRTLILSKVDESIVIGKQEYILYTNETNGVKSEGYKYLDKFEKDCIPIYTYNVKGVVIEKSISMVYGKNAVIITYKISNRRSKAKIKLTPIMNFRDFHAEKHDNKFDFEQAYNNQILNVKFNNDYSANIFVKDAKYDLHKNIFYAMHYETEKERGFDADENHYIPGTFEVDIKPNEDKKINFVCSLDGKYGVSTDDIKKLDGDKNIKEEATRIRKLISDSKLALAANIKKNNLDLNNDNEFGEEDKKIYKDIIRKYIIASDNFIVYRNSNNLHTLLAGYPWFLDWGRDAFIAFEGLVLIPKRYEIAKDILLTFANSIKEGLIPNGFSEYDGEPMYNSVDASLLFIDAVDKYVKYTKDYEFVKDNLYPKMKEIIDAYVDGIDLDGNNIYLDETDFLLVSGTKHTQNTWMDAKVNGRAVTPRSGKAVEINAMWYNALMIMVNLNSYFKKPLGKFEYAYLAKKCKKSFESNFYNESKRCLYDVIDTDLDEKVMNKYDEDFQYGNGDTKHRKDGKIRPNQLFAISMTNPVIDPLSDMGKQIFITVTEKLLNKYGLKTLSSEDRGYAPIYKGNPVERDLIYHQGITWPWLLGPYYDAFKNIIDGEEDSVTKNSLKRKLVQFRVKIANVFINEMENGNTIGSISEVYDSDEKASKGKAAFAQAWSVSEIFRIIIGK